MKGSRFSEEQIIGILREHAAGAKVPELCWRHVISLWTAPPYQAGSVSVLTIIDCKHLSGVSFLWCAQMGNPLTLSSTSGRPRRPSQKTGFECAGSIRQPICRTFKQPRFTLTQRCDTARHWSARSR
jgi:hypothetical protein